MINPVELKRDPDRPYLFKSPLKAQLMRWVDRIGEMIWGRKTGPISWSHVQRIAVLRLDHVGDVLMALPAMAAIEKVLPNAAIDLYVGPWSKGITDLSGLRSVFRVFSAPWFERTGKPRGTRAAVRELARSLREGSYDAVIEFRGDIRHIIAMKRSGIPVRIGQARSGGAFWLTHPVLFRHGLHEIDRNLDLLDQIGLAGSDKGCGLELSFGPGQAKEAQTEMDSFHSTKPFIAIHATCLATAKRWPEDYWRELVKGLPLGMDLVVIGSGGELPDAKRIFGPASRNVIFSMGKLSLPALAAFLSKARLFIGVDSAPAHIAAAVGTPVISLFSGTNQAFQWMPRGPKVTVLQKTTACSPCELVECPIGHECMKRIAVVEVLDSALAFLK